MIREEVPRTVPDRLTGLATGQLESVNQGITGSLALTAPLVPLAVHGEISGRTAGETRTPLGALPTASLNGYNAGLGVSWVDPRGYIGVAGREYSLSYGVPGTFNGEVIPGAHEGWSGGRHEAVDRPPGSSRAAGHRPFESIELDGSYVRFDQDELEIGGPGGPVVEESPGLRLV